MKRTGQRDGAGWSWGDHHGWPVLHIRDYHGNKVTLADNQVAGLRDFLAEHSPEVLMQEYRDCYAAMEAEADEEERQIAARKEAG